MSDTFEPLARIQSLENGKGVQYLLDEAHAILGNPSVLHNMEYQLISSAGDVVTDDRLWNEIVDKGYFSSESIRFFLEECFIDEVANSKIIALLTSDKLKYERLYGRIFNCYNNTVADLVMVACDRPFADGDAAAFEALSEKLSQEISKDEFYKNYGIQYHEKLISMLLHADIDDKLVYSGHLSNLYEDMRANLYALALDIGSTDRCKLEAVRDFCKEKHPEHKYAVHDGYIAVIVSTDDLSPNAARDLPELAGYFAELNARIGTSACFDNLFDLRKHYDEAIESLQKS